MIKLSTGTKAFPGIYRNLKNLDIDVKTTNGVEFFSNYLFPDFKKVQDHYELKNWGLCGNPGSGKTSYINFFCDFITRIWNGIFKNKCVNCIKTDSVQLAIEHFTDDPFQVIVIDDAMSQQDSRQAMKSDNITATQMFMLIRHIAKMTGAGGVVYTIWAYQSPKGIDIRFRDSLDLIIYKHYFRDAGLTKEIKSTESLKFLKEITRQEVQYNKYELRECAVGVTSWGDIVNLQIPYIKNFPLKEIQSKSRKQDIMNDLIIQLIDKDMFNDASTAYGFLYESKDKNPELELYNFNQTDFKQIFWRAKAKALELGLANSQQKLYFSKLVQFIKDNTPFTFDELEKLTGVPHSILHRVSKGIG